jgi:GntR family transcriptional repressor for pyruvate dehydrogenase complex
VNANGFVDRVVQTIERVIVEGRLGLRARRPPEREFAERLGVSRTVVREAERILVTKGLLETRHGVGTMAREMLAALSMQRELTQERLTGHGPR